MTQFMVNNIPGEVTCPKCGAALPPSVKQGGGICPYCGYQYPIPKPKENTDLSRTFLNGNRDRYVPGLNRHAGDHQIAPISAGPRSTDLHTDRYGNEMEPLTYTDENGMRVEQGAGLLREGRIGADGSIVGGSLHPSYKSMPGTELGDIIAKQRSGHPLTDDERRKLFEYNLSNPARGLGGVGRR